MSNKNLGIQGLRGVLMLWIILFHYTTRYSQLYPDNINFSILFPNGGVVGVILFFIISGFFFGQVICNYDTDDSYKSQIRQTFVFFFKRYIKLWKPYFLSCLIIVVFLFFVPLPGRTNTSIISILINFFFIWHPKIEYIDSAHWFMANLIYIQFGASLLLFIKKQYRRISVLVLLFLLLIGYTMHELQIGGGGINKLNYIFLFRNSLCFVLGMATNMNYKTSNILKHSIICISLLALSLFVATWWIITYYFIFILLINKSRLIYGIMSNPIFVFIGELSFYWYLLHQNIGYSILNKLSECGYHSEIMILVPLSVTFFMAYLVSLSLKCINYGKQYKNK